LEEQKQQFAVDQLRQENTARQKLGDYANTVIPGTETPGAMNAGLTAEAQGNQQIAPEALPNNPGNPDITGVQGVYEAPTGGEKPTLRMMLQRGVELGVNPRQLQAIAGAIKSSAEDAPLSFHDVPGVPGAVAVQGRGVHVVNPAASARGSVTDQIVRELATDPSGAFDPVKAQEVLKSIRTNPQGAEGRLTDYIIKRNQTGVQDPAMEKSISDYQNFISGNTRSRARGTEGGKEQGLQDVIQSRLQRMTREELAKNSGRPLPDSAQTAVTAMQDGILIASKLKDDFSPQERAQYVGYFRLPAQRLAQFIKGDPRFAEFNALLKRSEGTAFGEGGKQLTGIEKDVVFGYIPTGKELSVADFEAKINQAIDMGENRIRNRYEVSRAGKGEPGDSIPALNNRGAAPRSPSSTNAAQAPAIPKDKMLIRDSKTGKEFLYPVGDVPDGFGRIK
jgi:hypothetical protein